MLMTSNGQKLNLWDSPYANRIAAPPTSKLRLETARQASTVMGNLSTRKVDRGTKVEVSGGGEVKVTKVKRLSTKSWFSPSPKSKPPDRLFGLQRKVPILLWFIIFNADCFILYQCDNSYETRYNALAQRSSCLIGARPSLLAGTLIFSLEFESLFNTWLSWLSPGQTKLQKLHRSALLHLFTLRSCPPAVIFQSIRPYQISNRRFVTLPVPRSMRSAIFSIIQSLCPTFARSLSRNSLSRVSLEGF